MDILKKLQTALGSNKKDDGNDKKEGKSLFSGRFFDAKKNFSPEAQKSGAGIAYSELITRSSRIVTTNLVCVGIIGVLVIKIVFLTNPVTIVTPPNMTEEVTLVGNKASESYKTQWAMFYSTMLGNINPKNIQFVMNYILDSLSPELQAKTGEALESQISIMQARGVDQTFRANDIYFDPKNDMVYVWGTKTTTLLNVPDKSESSKWTFEWVIGMKNGRPRIAHVNQYAGTPNIKKITVNGKEQLATLDNPPPSTGK
ncbi:pilus assembly protein [Lelliottia amnigena]|uniref:TraE/TraK family type IV conjugative transfer system protein n=1 Tax=Lelliottia TaxID=1330545 RepID=UPI00192AD9CD|nr:MULTISPECIES: TraE/TraK family type IV conjugative transfer system protein [Lelliottia]MBL5885660.1 pilus assembly protein [Lelliottia aquatilis]MBL5923238.1 pilus assembly protein [Lelliottia amnigena]MBL5932148.1 pilus assembly protein [Lelliottia amnigena]